MTTSTISANTSIGNSSSDRFSYARFHSYAQNVYFRDGLLLTGILVGLLYLILALSLDEAGYVRDMFLLVPVTLGAMILGTLMAFSRFDGFFAFSHSMFTGLAWILFLMARRVSLEEIEPILSSGIPEFQAKTYYILIRWVNWVELALASAASEENYVFIFEISFLIWWLTYLGAWAIFRYGYTWRAIMPAGIVLLINTYYAPQPLFGFLFAFCLIALILLVRTNLADQQRRWREKGIYFNPDISWDFLRNGMMFSIAIVVFAWLTPGLSRNSYVRQALSPLNERWNETTQTIREWYPNVISRTQPAGSAFGRKLSLGGARNVGNSPVFQVASSERGRYWRAVAFDTFDGRQWSNSDETELQFATDDTVPVGNWELRKPFTQTITLLAPTGNVIFGAPDIYKVDVPITAVYHEVPANPVFATNENAEELAGSAIEVTWAKSNRLLDVGDSYTVVSRFTDITQRALRSASTEYPPDIRERYLQLPEDFSERVANDAAQIMAPYDSVYDKVRTLELHLRGYEYREDIDAPPPGRDPIEYFLYDIQAGYCDYYATAMTTMLRSAGIPARTASGYAEGIFDEENGFYTITERDAHTWVEVYFPGFGWVEFEPTAGESALNRPVGNDFTENGLLPGFNPGDQSGIPSEEELLQNQLENPGDFDNFPEDDPLNAVGTSQQGVFGWLRSILITLLAIAGILFLLFRQRIMGPTSFTSDIPPILFDRMQRWAERLGIRTQNAHTPYEQASQFSRALPEGRKPIETITNNFVYYQFGRGEEATGATRNIIQKSNAELPGAWRQLNKIFWRAWMRRLFSKYVRRGSNPYSLVD